MLSLRRHFSRVSVLCAFRYCNVATD
jgi:hypothetical protein